MQSNIKLICLKNNYGQRSNHESKNLVHFKKDKQTQLNNLLTCKCLRG